MMLVLFWRDDNIFIFTLVSSMEMDINIYNERVQCINLLRNESPVKFVIANLGARKVN